MVHSHCLTDRILPLLPPQTTYEKLLNEVPKYKMITPSILYDRLRVNASLARAAIKELAGKGLIKAVEHHGSQQIYTRAIGQ